MPVTLLLSVGGAPGPIVYSIHQNQPECIIFFVSLTALPSPLLPGDRAEPKGEPTSGDDGLEPEDFN